MSDDIDLFLHVKKIVEERESKVESTPDHHFKNLFCWSLKKGHLPIVRYLLDLGANVNGGSLKYELIANPLRKAAKAGQLELVGLLLERGADPNYGFGDTLLMAAKHGHLEIVDRLLDHEADINGILDDIETQDDRAVLERVVFFEKNRDCAPPTVAAIRRENAAIFRLIRKRRAALNTPETGGKALRVAVENGLESMVELLLEGGELDGSLIDAAIQKHEKVEMAWQKYRCVAQGMKGKTS